MIDRMTCLLCPAGCELEVRNEAGSVKVLGAKCAKGEDFGIEEALHPLRNLATSVLLAGTEADMVSVRLSRRVARDLIIPILAEISKLRPAPPVRRGQVLIADVLGSGTDVIATRTVLSRHRTPAVAETI